MTKHPQLCEGSSQYRGMNISQEIAFFNRGGFPLYASNRSFWKLWPPSQPRVEDHPKPRPRAFNRAKGKAGKGNKVGIRIFLKSFLIQLSLFQLSPLSPIIRNILRNQNNLCFSYHYSWPFVLLLLLLLLSFQLPLLLAFCRPKLRGVDRILLQLAMIKLNNLTNLSWLYKICHLDLNKINCSFIANISIFSDKSIILTS